jgi:hypothetical protein
MADSTAFEPVQRSNDHIPVAARVNELSADAQASRPRLARGLLRPSQVPVPGGTTWPAGLPSPAGERAHHGLKALRPGGVSTGAAPVPARPSTVPAQPIPDLLPGSSQPLAAPVKEEMEARLGADFSRVRVHTGSAARASAAGVGARAYTFGPHVVIGGGGADKHTLAHELTHVIQQRQGPVAGTDHGNWLKLSDPSDHDEKAAEVNAARVMRAPLSQHLLTAAGSSVHDGNENLRKPPAQDRQPRGDRDADRSGTNPPVAVQRLAIGDAPTTWGGAPVSRSGEGRDGVFFVGPGGARVVVKPLRSTGNVEYANYFMRQMGLTAPATVRYAKTSREGQAITRLLMANQDKGRDSDEVKTQVENASAYLVMEMLSGTSIQTLDDAKQPSFSGTTRLWNRSVRSW